MYHFLLSLMLYQLSLTCPILAVTKEEYITMILPSGKYRPRYSPKQFFGVTEETTV